MAKTSRIENRTPETGRLRSSIGPLVVQRLLLLWLVLVVLAVAVMPMDSKRGLSLLWGFSVCLLPGISFAWYAFRCGKANIPIAAVGSFYRAEAIKFFLTACLFAAAFLHADKVDLAVFFLAFIAAQIASWILAWITIRQ